MNVKNDQLYTTINITQKDDKEFKAWVTEERFYSVNPPNKETLKAIEKAEKGKDLVEVDDVEDLFKKLGI